MMLITYFVPIFITLLLIEAYLSYRFNKHSYELKDTFASLALGVGSLAIGAVAKVGILFIMEYLYELTPLKIPTDALTTVLCFICVDFCLYWAHRFGHETRMGWAAHVSHHTSQKYNLATALRQSWTHHYFFIFYLPIALIGFDPKLAAILNGVNTIYQFFLHTEFVGKLGPLEWIFNTPSHHRVHHGANPKYIDKNFGGTFIIWDRLFGTFQEEEEEVKFGITKNVNSYNPFYLAFHEWVDMCYDAYKTPGWRNKLKRFYKKPEWNPIESANTEKNTDYSERLSA